MVVAAKTHLQPSQVETVYAAPSMTVPTLTGSHPERSRPTPIAPTRPPATGQYSLQTPDVEHRSVDDEELIASVESLAATIQSEVENVSLEIQSYLDSWADLHGIPATPDRTTRELIATQAAFAHLLKATLYEWHHRQDALPALSRPTRAAFREADNRIDTLAFDECVLDELVYLTDASDRDRVIEERTRLLDSTQPTEDIGRLYEAVVPREYRQSLGQFRTPPPLAALVKSWAIRGDECVLDPGVGAGALTSPSHPDWELSTELDHVHGIDRSPLSVLMAATAHTLLDQSHTLHQTDFLNLQPSDLGDSIDTVVANPPFTQGSDLPASYNKHVNEQFEDMTGIDISSQSPLFTYFVIQVRTAFLTTGDRAAFITPWNFLATEYGTALKAFLCETCSVEAFVKLDQDVLQAFGNANTTTLVTFVEARAETDSQGRTRFIRVDENVDERTIRETIRAGRQGETDWGSSM